MAVFNVDWRPRVQNDSNQERRSSFYKARIAPRIFIIVKQWTIILFAVIRGVRSADIFVHQVCGQAVTADLFEVGHADKSLAFPSHLPAGTMSNILQHAKREHRSSDAPAAWPRDRGNTKQVKESRWIFESQAC